MIFLFANSFLIDYFCTRNHLNNNLNKRNVAYGKETIIK